MIKAYFYRACDAGLVKTHDFFKQMFNFDLNQARVDVFDRIGDNFIPVSFNVKIEPDSVKFYDFENGSIREWNITYSYAYYENNIMAFEKDGYYFILYIK